MPLETSIDNQRAPTHLVRCKQSVLIRPAPRLVERRPGPAGERVTCHAEVMVEPVSPDPPEHIGGTLLTQAWLDLAFIHWAVAPELVSGLVPARVQKPTSSTRPV
jgi:hypothetical protein